MLEGVIIQLPDGTTMTLADFNANVNSGIVDVSDSGFILPDGTILPTNGEPLFGAYPEEMIALMQPYIVDNNSVPYANGEPVEINSSDYTEQGVPTTFKIFEGLILIGLIAYIFNKK